MICTIPDCANAAKYRGLCQRHLREHPAEPPDWLCTCETPDRIYLPAFDDPHYPDHHGHYCARCHRPPIEGLHPSTQMRHRNTSQGDR